MYVCNVPTLNKSENKKNTRNDLPLEFSEKGIHSPHLHSSSVLRLSFDLFRVPHPTNHAEMS